MKIKILIFYFILILLSTNSVILGQNISDTTHNSSLNKKYILPSGAHTITKDFLIGKTHYEKDSSFVLIDKKHTILSPIYGRIQKITYAAYLKMYEAALKDGIKLTVTSASRNYWVQRYIWDVKWNKYKDIGKNRVLRILQYSSMPGISRHHWGTDMDFNGTSSSYWSSNSGQKTYNWLKNNAHKYGFFQPYTSKTNNDRTGFNEEKWHWSYAPLSNIYTKAYIDLIEISDTKNDIKGFAGDQFATELDIINTYVLGIDNL